MRSPTRALVPAVLVLAALLAPAASAAQPKSPTVIPATSGKIDGRTYGEWSAEWWRQGYAVPTSVSPFLEDGAANCGLGDKSVRFLFGTFAQQTPTGTTTWSAWPTAAARSRPGPGCSFRR